MFFIVCNTPQIQFHGRIRHLRQVNIAGMAEIESGKEAAAAAGCNVCNQTVHVSLCVQDMFLLSWSTHLLRNE